MPKIEVINLKGEKVGSVDLPDEVFSAPVMQHLVWESVRHHLARRRAGTASTKSRGEVSGGGRKPWRAKGTGRARVGSIRNPLWRGGGTAHGPKPRSYDYRLPKKVRRGALRSILSQRLASNRLRVVENLEPEEMKTRAFVETARKLGLESAVFVDRRENSKLCGATRNVPTMLVIDHFALNPYDLMRFENIVFSRAAVESVSEALKPRARKQGA
ncbi:MAG TPA: 50S ribosomal protein L4 [Acidobacteriota bacterium]|nr:50S ribosomal protein L4 [Acidobacteriota bacterium]